MIAVVGHVVHIGARLLGEFTGTLHPTYHTACTSGRMGVRRGTSKSGLCHAQAVLVGAGRPNRKTLEGVWRMRNGHAVEVGP